MSIDYLQSARERFTSAAAESLARRAGIGLGKPPSAAVRDLEHASLLTIAEESLCFGGRQIKGDPDTIARAALGDQNALSIFGADVPYSTPGDFPHVLSSLANKVMDAAPPYAGTTFKQWAHQRPSVKDFKPATLHRLGEFGELPLHQDGDDFEQSKPAEETSWMAVDSYGDEFALTPKMIIDDDLGAFVDGLSDKQAAHDQTLNRLCVNLLIGNPVGMDGYALFDDATHSNDIAVGSGGPPDTGQLSAMRLKLRQQTGSSGKRKLALTLAGLLIPEELETTTQQLLASTLAVYPTTESAAPVFKGQVTWWVEPMLSDHSAVEFFGFADPRLARSIVYAYQAGFEKMKVRSYYNPKNNCLIYQFEGRFAASANNFRGVVRNAGR